MGVFDKASLALVPDGIKDGKLYSIKPTDGSGDFTFTRGSNLAATRVDENGLIEKGRENLLLQSNQFDTTAWNISNVSGGQSGYDGTNDAWLQSGASRLQQAISLSTGVYTFSLYLKGGYSNYCEIRVVGSISIVLIYELTGNGSIITSNNAIDSKIDLIGNGWYKVSGTFNASVTTFRIYPKDDSSGSQSSSSSVYIQDTQLEIGLTSTEYIESGATTGLAGILEDLPRIDYTGGTPSLLMEPSRTNFIPNSEYANGGSVSSATITDNVTISPEGVQNAARFVPTSGFGRWQSATFGGSITNGTTYVTSMYFNTGSTLDIVTFYIGWDGVTGAERIGIKFNPSTRAYISTFAFGSATLTDYNISEADSNGWYRVSLIAPATNPNVNTQIVVRDLNNIANNSDFVDFYGWQMEQGSYPTSYIPTYGASATRSNDFFKIINQEGLFSANKGTFFVEFSFNENNKYIGVGDSWPTDKITIGLNSSGTNQIRSIIRNNGSNIYLQGSDTTLGENIKACVSYGSDGFKLFMNGSLQASNSTPANLSQFSDLIPNVDVRDSSSTNNSGNIKQILVFPEALSDTECITLTT